MSLAWCREPSSHLSLPLVEPSARSWQLPSRFQAVRGGLRNLLRGEARSLAVIRLARRFPLGFAAGRLFFALLKLFLLLLLLGAIAVGALLEVVGLHRHGRSPGTGMQKTVGRRR